MTSKWLFVLVLPVVLACKIETYDCDGGTCGEPRAEAPSTATCAAICEHFVDCGAILPAEADACASSCRARFEAEPSAADEDARCVLSNGCTALTANACPGAHFIEPDGG